MKARTKKSNYLNLEKRLISNCNTAASGELMATPSIWNIMRISTQVRELQFGYQVLL